MNETVMNETVMNETVMNETVMNETAVNETAVNETVMNETVMNETVMNETVMNETVMNETVMNETAVSKTSASTTIGVTMDCRDVARIAAFWREALGYDEPNPVTPDAPFHALVSPGGGLHHLTLQRVPEAKSGKNRVHLDLFVDDLGSEMARLLDLGATVVAEHDDDGGYQTAILADPEGNEFCVVRRS